jgi:hypothetical protein
MQNFSVQKQVAYMANTDLDKGANQASLPHEFVENKVKIEKGRKYA